MALGDYIHGNQERQSASERLLQYGRYGLVGLPGAAAIGSAVSACGQCAANAVNPWALLAVVGGAALFVATGKRKGK